MRTVMKIRSQNGEDAILDRWLVVLDSSRRGFTRTFVEIGVSLVHETYWRSSYVECNTGRLREDGWAGLWIDADEENELPGVVTREFVTAENVNELFLKYDVPKELGVLSIDVDGNDWWIWKALSAEWWPAVVVVEYNPRMDPTKDVRTPYDPQFRWDRSSRFGSSAEAFRRLGWEKGYLLASCVNKVNLVFLREDVAPEKLVGPSLEELSGDLVYFSQGDYDKQREQA